MAEHLQDILQDLVNIDAFLYQHETIAGDPGDIEQVVDEAYLEVEIAPDRLQRGKEGLRGE